MERLKQDVLERLHSLDAQVRWVCDAMIPADPEGLMPSARDAGVPEIFLPRALALRDDWAAAFIAALASLPPEAPREPLAAIRALDPQSYYIVGQLVAGAYFMNAQVRQALRYPGQQSLHDEPDYDEIMAAAERVQARGSAYVEPGPG
ncbi:hypothetical protein [Aquabacterium sp. J223]|uniref:hypothetical protein n=1 Tax=Aquabacterium sp. J223 TaxID=2898431 RepID=UPI0021AD98EF|nr:hypothetical protein [Aquabacterium sp. J223]UUX94044.1 hypothetical protein LRS07_11850 [Aquabacterium sp. J223]